MLNTIYNIDSRLLLDTIPKEILIQTTITSPPYFDMKDYGVENQIGYGQKYDDYLDDLQFIFKQVLERTKKDGTLWIIIDTFKRNNVVIPLPFDLANKLKIIGWKLQEIIIWKKDKTVPWSTKGFMQRKFEYILFFSKGSEYKSNKDRVRIYDIQQLKKWWIKYPERYNPKGKALDEIWEYPIPIQGSWGDEYIRHFCPLPKEMVATMIEISTDENDIVLDPFAGSGTVLSQSAYMHRDYIGFELNNDYINMFQIYLERTINQGHHEYDKLKNNDEQKNFENQILNLRALKFGRLLLNNIEKITGINNLKILVERKGYSNKLYKSIIVKYSIIGYINQDPTLSIISDLISSPPLSKFGIDPIFDFVENMQFNKDKYYGYTKTNSHSYIKNANFKEDKVKIISEIKVDLQG